MASKGSFSSVPGERIGFFPPAAGIQLSTQNRKEAFSEQAVGTGGSEMGIRKMLSDWEGKLGTDHPSIAAVVASLAAVLEQQRQWEEAQALHQRTLKLQEKWSGPWHENVAEARENVARCALMNSNYNEAQSLLEVAMKIRQKSGKETKIARCMELMADVRLATNDHAGALQLLDRAVTLVDKHDSHDPERLAGLLMKLAELQSASGSAALAGKSVARAVSILHRQSTLTSMLPHALSLQAGIATLAMEYEAAEKTLRECLRINESLNERNGIAVAKTATQLANVLSMQQKNAEEAEMLFQRSIDILEGISGLSSETLTVSFKGYADFLHQNSRHEDAEILYRHCVNLVRQQGESFPGSKEELSSLQNRVGVCLAELEKYSEAEVALQAALRLREQCYPASSLKIAISRESLGNLLLHIPGREAEALPLLEESLGMREKLVAEGILQLGDLVDQMIQLGMLLKQMDRYTEGDKLCKRGEELRRSCMDPDLREIEDYMREEKGSERASPRLIGRFVRYPTAAATRRSGRSLTAAQDGSPRVQPVKSPGKNQRKAHSSLASHDFQQWAVSSGHLEEALAAARASSLNQSPEHVVPTTKQPVNQQQRPRSTRQPAVHNRYNCLELDDSILDVEEEDALGDSIVSGIESNFADDDVLLGTVQHLTLGDTWDFATTDTVPVRIMVQHAQKERGATGSPQPHINKAASQQEDLNTLLKTITTSDQFRSNDLEDSLGKLDGILKQVRMKASNMRGSRPTHIAGSSTAHLNSQSIHREGSLDAIIRSLDMEDLLNTSM